MMRRKQNIERLFSLSLCLLCVALFQACLGSPQSQPQTEYRIGRVIRQISYNHPSRGFRVMPAKRIADFPASRRAMYGHYSPYIPHSTGYRVMPANLIEIRPTPPRGYPKRHRRPHHGYHGPQHRYPMPHHGGYRGGKTINQGLPPTIHHLPAQPIQPSLPLPPHQPPHQPLHQPPIQPSLPLPPHQPPHEAPIQPSLPLPPIPLPHEVDIPIGGKQPGGCNCVHLVSCPFSAHQNSLNGCSLRNGASGICCPQAPSNAPWGGVTRLFEPQIPNVPVPPMSMDQVNLACHKGMDVVKNIQQVEDMLMQSGNVLRRGTPARGHLKFFQITRTARSSHKGAMAINKASEAMKRQFSLTNEQSCIGLRRFSARNTILGEHCPAPPRCNPHHRYRTMDGSCNNLKKPLWGRSETAFQRILPAHYDDGLRMPRVRSVAGGPLPNERRISQHILIDFDNPDPQFTLSVMQFGQFLDHDLTHTPFASFDNNEGKECCREGELVTPQLLEDCWPIVIPPDDPFFSSKNQKCMNFIRSMIAEDNECSFGCAEQMNQVTHWLDGSSIYGSKDDEFEKIMERGGFMKVSDNNLLPFQEERSHDCEASQGATCFMAGDSRVNEQPGLTAIHTIWHREHNRVARALTELNPSWNAETVFHEARRIVVAEYQHITYNEWLPVVVGEPFMRSFDIMPKTSGYRFDYNPNINPNMYNEFATSAFRFGHTLVQGHMTIISRNGRVEGDLNIKDHFNSPSLFQNDPEMVDKFARTFSKQSGQSFDPFISQELTNHLFETKTTGFGMDLMSLNIHRGRDHAIATYNEVRVICGLPRATTFDDLLDQMHPDTIRRMASVYRHVDDIDFFVGGISEKPVAGGLLGWTFLCVVGDQFARVKKGDRFFYDIGGQPGSFTPDQLHQLKRASWSRILCDNSKMGTVQPLAFQLPSQHNPEVHCDSPSIPRIDLRFWQGGQH